MLDTLLAVLLLAVVPARALWRSLTGRAGTEPKTRRYITTIAMVAGLLGLLAIDWAVAGRGLAALGLGPPTTTAALAGIGFAVAALATLILSIRRKPASPPTGAKEMGREIMPETPGEVRLFLLLGLAVGCGWEILYRGFLLFFLAPQIGLWPAVAAAVIAYGAAHGYQGAGRFAGSIGAALVFTVGYVVTDSLWWLMLLHSGLTLVGLLAQRRIAAQAA